MKRTFIIYAMLLSGLLCTATEGRGQTGGALFTPGPTMHRTRISPLMATLPDGRIAAFGGREFNFISCSYADIYDPATNSFTEISMNIPHDFASVAKLADGRYYIAGGAMDLGVAPGYSGTEMFNPATNTFMFSGAMNQPRCGLSAVQMASGKVLIAGAWYNTSGATYADVYNPFGGGYTATNALIEPRAYPLVLPTNDSGAVVFGGMPSYGGSGYTSVEFYSPADNSFHSMASELIPADAGWLTGSTAWHSRPAEDYKMTSGKYLILASRTGEYGLLTFDPATKVFARITTSSPLMDSLTDGGFFDIVLDKTGNFAYILGLDAGSSPWEISLIAVNLTTGYVYHPGSTFTMPVTEFLYPTMAFIPSNGKILLEGVSSTTGDYFHATDKTYLVTPQPALGVTSTVSAAPKPVCYPNPANDVLNIKFDDQLTGTTDIAIYDMTGRKLDQQRMSASSVSVAIPVGKLPAGVYFYEVRNNGSVARDRFIKQ